MVKEMGGSANYPILPRWLGDLPHEVYGPWDVIETGDSIYQEYRMVLESPRGEGLYGHREAVCEAGMEHCSHDANRG